jgi:peptidoglycan/xylan/chitin deacetylase (PgdA/CDA1 family)
MGYRERFASALYGAGALGALMEVRKRLPMPPTLSVVTYHHVAEDTAGYKYDPGVADATPAQFRRQMELVAKYCTPIGIDEVVRAVEGAPLPRNPILITFDDGYKSCRETALPILQSLGIPAVFFIATGFVNDRTLYWWERIALILSSARGRSASLTYPLPLEINASDPRAMRTLTAIVKDTHGLDLERFLGELARGFGVTWDPELERMHSNDLVMTWDDVRALAKAGMNVESHSRRHRVLQTLDPASLAEDLLESKRELEAQLGQPVRAIAYPVGRKISHLPAVRHAVEAAGYKLGFTNASGATTIWPGAIGKLAKLDPYDLHRVSTEREMSDAMFFTQIALPGLAYIRAT